jgi:hypothetical protein
VNCEVLIEDNNTTLNLGFLDQDEAIDLAKQFISAADDILFWAVPK